MDGALELPAGTDLSTMLFIPKEVAAAEVAQFRCGGGDAAAHLSGHTPRGDRGPPRPTGGVVYPDGHLPAAGASAMASACGQHLRNGVRDVELLCEGATLCGGSLLWLSNHVLGTLAPLDARGIGSVVHSSGCASPCAAALGGLPVLAALRRLRCWLHQHHERHKTIRAAGPLPDGA